VITRPPLRHLSTVCHIGTLDLADKGPFSWEAQGLSVSIDPTSWEAIAELGGQPWHLLERRAGAFLDYHRLGPRTRLRVARWAVARGLLTRVFVHQRTWWDDELESESGCYHDTRAEAIEEAEETADNESSVRRVVTYPGAPLLAQRAGTRLPEYEAFDAALLCYVEDEHPAIDGVWWEDRYLPLSAPRGCILPRRLAAWTRREVTREQASRLLNN
jgi:hypothetical protein